MKGFVHSIETFGTVDGPSIRMVVFMSGCLLKCIFCHNPDVAWGEQGKYYSPEQILDKYNRNRLFYEKGGITFSGVYKKQFTTNNVLLGIVFDLLRFVYCW